MSGVARVRVATWNLQGGNGLLVEDVATALREMDADLVLLQEVQPRQLRALRHRAGYPHAWWSFKHWPPRKRREGLGVLARGRVSHRSVQRLTHDERPWSWRRRIAQHGVCEVAAARVPFVNTHLGAGVTEDERLQQAYLLLRRRAPDALVGGDLNAAPATRVLAAFEHAGLHDTWHVSHPARPDPATNWAPGLRDVAPRQRLDYVLVPADVDVVDTEVPNDWRRWASLSDHLPVIATLEATESR